MRTVILVLLSFLPLAGQWRVMPMASSIAAREGSLPSGKDSPYRLRVIPNRGCKGRWID